MRTPITSPISSRGFTLLEIITATAITAALAASSVVVVRTAHAAWRRHHDDQLVRTHATSALQHIARHVRQAVVVTHISDASDDSGELSIQNADGSVETWSHASPEGEILFGVDGEADLLAAGVTSMTFLGIRANGWQATTSAELVHGVRCTLKYDVDRPTGSVEESASCQAWIRSW